ncbi:chorismate-binding protein [Rubrivirga sp. S365]|uniref:Anthranilate synthase component 1 n=1 Tax=Rubrivirga litoralis TaxID=3075598 RepID=A0ABU3BRK1_9BACT|nr:MULTISPECIES: chorismate-binding protein [unclassified Rubrivirga]MDT0631899.1 chorismate-binding protein [Rubrivirga sp. F394]MDT7857952.1 chorismate-binding protein [Rubrivirga sp. S365]
MTLSEFETTVREQLPADGRKLAVPVYVRRSADLLTPVAAFLALREPGQFGFLFESVEGGERLGRYSFLGKRPYLVVESRGGRVLTHRPAGAVGGDGAPHDVESRAGSVFDALGEVLEATEQARVPGLPRLTSGAVGFAGYDAVRQVESLPPGPPDVLGLPDGVWGFYDTVAAFDHVRHQLVLMATVFVDAETDLGAAYAEATTRLLELEDDLLRGVQTGEPVRLLADEPQASVERADYEAAVRRGKEHVYEGDVFQVVLSQRFAMPFAGDRFNLYRALRQVNPSPYLFYLDVDGLDSAEGPFTLVGSSPEVLTRVDPRGAGRRALVLPIAGTRRRGETDAEDAEREADLLADPKERAEHLMLVDLGRNDVGRVSDVGTVTVDRFAEVERFSHVMHLVSSVSGAVGDRRAVDVLAACFPAGTVSGAPKVRAMEIIDELEPIRRGPYAGAVGYAGFDGALDTCIAIRTMIVKEDGAGRQAAYVQAGAGVVADSDPAAEYDETRAKAAALFAAMRSATSDLL